MLGLCKRQIAPSADQKPYFFLCRASNGHLPHVVDGEHVEVTTEIQVDYELK